MKKTSYQAWQAKYKNDPEYLHKRIAELEKEKTDLGIIMQEYVDTWESINDIESLKYLAEITRDKFKQLLSKRNRDNSWE